MNRQEGWIDADKRLPPRDHIVWCYGDGCGIFIGGRAAVGDDWQWAIAEDPSHTPGEGPYCGWSFTEWCYDDMPVTHWAELPEPPK